MNAALDLVPPESASCTSRRTFCLGSLSENNPLVMACAWWRCQNRPDARSRSSSGSSGSNGTARTSTSLEPELDVVVDSDKDIGRRKSWISWWQSTSTKSPSLFQITWTENDYIMEDNVGIAFHPFIIAGWVWHASLRVVADGVAEARDTRWPGYTACGLYTVSQFLHRLLISWMLTRLAGIGGTWTIVASSICLTILTFADCSLMTGTCMFGLFFGVSFCVMPVLLAFGKPGRWKLVVAMTAWAHAMMTSLAFYVRYVHCIARSVPHIAVGLRIAMPFFEVVSRGWLNCIWQRWCGTAPAIVFNVHVVLSVVIPEISSFANFVSLAETPNPWKSALLLAVLSVFADLLSRSRLLRVLADAAFFKRRYRISWSSDIALRARWSYVYTLFPTALLLLAGWEYCVEQVPHVSNFLVLAYFVTELIADLATLLWQHFLRWRTGFAKTGTWNLLDTLREVQKPFSHLVPQIIVAPTAVPEQVECLFGRDRMRTGDPSCGSDLPEPDRGLWGLRPDVTAGLYVSMIASNYTYLSLAGQLLPEICAW